MASRVRPAEDTQGSWAGAELTADVATGRPPRGAVFRRLVAALVVQRLRAVGEVGARPRWGRGRGRGGFRRVASGHDILKQSGILPPAPGEAVVEVGEENVCTCGGERAGC